jgi:protein polybromo-1
MHMMAAGKEKPLETAELLQARRAAAAEARKQDSEAAEDTSESSTNPDDEANMYEDLFTAVMMATDQDNRPLHTVFQLLPSKKVKEGSKRGVLFWGMLYLYLFC